MPIIKTVERDQYHTLPNTTCLFSTVDNCTHEQCSSNTRHYCLKECLDGAYSIDGKVVCGRPFCIPCTTHYGYEHMSLCPFCHPDSKYPHAPHNKVVSPPRSALRPATTPTSSLRSFSQSPGGEAPPAIKDLSDQVVKCEVLYCNHATFFNQIQDKGKPFSDAKKRTENGYWKAKNGSLQYKVIRECATAFLKRLRSKPEWFVNMPKLTTKDEESSTSIGTVCRWIIQKRDQSLKTRGEMSACVDTLYWNYVKDEIDETKCFYLLEQRSLLLLACANWGNTMEKLKKTFTKDDQIRLVGILLHPIILGTAKLDVIHRNRIDRETIDDPSMTKKKVFHEIAELFGNKSQTLQIEHPPDWDEAVEKNADGSALNPNNQSRMNLDWTGDEMSALYSFVKTSYKAAMKNWTKGTGGGDGAPENYGAWNTRCNSFFHGYATAVSAGMELTWIYMYDKLKEFPLFSAFEGLPKHASAEDGDIWEGVESIGSKSALKKNDTDIHSSAKTLASVAVSLVTAVEKMQTSFGQSNDVSAKTTNKRTYSEVNSELAMAEKRYVQAKANWKKKGDDLGRKKLCHTWKRAVKTLEKEIERITVQREGDMRIDDDDNDNFSISDSDSD